MRDKLISPKELMKFTVRLFENQWQRVAYILSGLLKAGSIRLSRIAHQMEGNPVANYKAIERFLRREDPHLALRRLFLQGAECVVMDVVGIERPRARKTAYVGRLKDGKTRGFWLLVLACPYKGRAIPFHFISYSSRTIGQESTSRNLEHKRALREVRGLIGDRPVVLDREFSYETFLEACRQEGIEVIIRLNASSRVSIRDEEAEEITLELRPGERVIRKGVYYKGRQRVNLAGQWGRGFGEPLWLITTLEPEEALKKYPLRMKIEECFRDLKDKLGMGQVMNKRRENMEKMIALLMIAYGLAVLIGEEVRERLSCHAKELYSGLHVLLRQRLPFIPGLVQEAINNVLNFLLEKTYCTVRTCV